MMTTEEWNDKPTGNATERLYTENELQAAIAEAMMGAVKPLEWDIQNMARDTWGNHYEVRQGGNNWELDHPQLMGEYIFDSETEAKAAAQDDYAARILSALSIPTDAIAALEERDKQVRTEALEEAARVAEEITTSQHIAHDMKLGVFPSQTDLRDAIAATIRAMKGGE